MATAGVDERLSVYAISMFSLSKPLHPASCTLSTSLIRTASAGVVAGPPRFFFLVAALSVVRIMFPVEWMLLMLFWVFG